MSKADLASKLEDSSVVAIDVRSEEEVRSFGPVRAGANEALNVPLPEILTGALRMNDEDFLDHFGFDKPSKSDTLVFSCLAGVRSEAAAKEALASGYERVFNFRGGATEWFAPP